MTGRGNIRVLEGMRFGRLVVTSEHKRMRMCTFWKCVCSCGTEKFISGQDLLRGATRSCGCLHRERTRESNRRRAKSQERLHTQDQK